MLVRFFNFLIDSSFIAIFAIIIVSLTVKYSSVNYDFSEINNRILAFIIYFLYYFLCEILFSSTLGKMITKTRVVDNITVLKPSLAGVLIRTLSRLIPFEAFSIFFDSDNLLWHDKISRTTVINNN